MLRLSSLILLSVLLSARPVVAQTAPTDAPAPTRAPWLTLGVGVASLAAYPGSDDRRTMVLPVVSIDLGRFYLGGNANASGGAGVFLVRDARWTWSLDLGGTIDRPADVSDDLDGFEDRGYGTTFGSAASLRVGAVQLGLAAATGLGSDVGNSLRANVATQRLLGARWLLGGALGVTLADGRAMDWDFGVDARDAAASGLAPFSADAGLRDLNAGVSLTLIMGHHTALSAFSAMSWLSNEAAKSPLVKQRTAPDFGIALVRTL